MALRKLTETHTAETERNVAETEFNRLFDAAMKQNEAAYEAEIEATRAGRTSADFTSDDQN